MRSGVRRTALIVIVVGAVAGAAWWWRSQGAPVAYVTTPVSRGQIAPHVTASGSINPVVTVQVGTYVSGVIKELRCDFNTRVKKGQLCARIDPLPYQTVVDQAQANLAAAQAQLNKDQANLEYTRLVQQRNSGLLRSGYVSKDAAEAADNDYRQAQAQIKVDEANVKQHSASLAAAQVNLQYISIVSPVDGTVVSRNVTQGQTVAASFQTPTLFVIAADLTQMQVDTSISESDIGAIAIGDETTFTVEAYPDRTFHGQVIQVRQSPQTVQNVVTYDVIVNAGNPDLLLMPGMTAAARIVTQRHADVLRIPNQALRYVPTSRAAESNAEADGKGGRVWVLRDGTLTALRVDTGLADDVYTEVTSGDLGVGDALIVAERTAKTEPAARGPGQATTRVPRL